MHSRREFLGSAAATASLPFFRSQGKVDDEKIVARAEGVELQRVEEQVYLLRIDTRAGAALRLLQKPTGEMNNLQQPLYERKLLREWWKEWSADAAHAFAMSNGQFFNPSVRDHAPLAFSLRSNREVLRGYGDRNEFRGQKQLLVLGQEPTIRPYGDDPKILEDVEHDAIVGLNIEAPKSPERSVGRTLAGVDARGILLILSAQAATQQEAAQFLEGAGAKQALTVMFDGGGSTQLIHRESNERDGKIIVPALTEQTHAAMLRALPQVLGIEAAPK